MSACVASNGSGGGYNNDVILNMNELLSRLPNVGEPPIKIVSTGGGGGGGKPFSSAAAGGTANPSALVLDILKTAAAIHDNASADGGGSAATLPTKSITTHHENDESLSERDDGMDVALNNKGSSTNEQLSSSSEHSSSSSTNSSQAYFSEAETKKIVEVVVTTTTTSGESVASEKRLLRSALKAFSPQDLHINNRKSSWKTLPSPKVLLKPHHMLNTIAPPAVATAVATNGACNAKKNVSFGLICIRNYEQTLGDNPSVSYGPPISLDWKYEECEPIDVNDYETHRRQRRNARQMMLSYYNRRNLLTWRFGISEEELKEAHKQADKVKFQRSITRALLPACKLEETMESAKRKFKRLTTGGGGDGAVGNGRRQPPARQHSPQLCADA